MRGKTVFAIIGFVTCMMQIADFTWGASLSWRGISPDAIRNASAALGYAFMGIFADG